MRVNVYVVISYVDNVIRIKNGPAINGSGTQDMFVIEDDYAVKRKVEIGATNFDYAEIESGIKENEIVIISNMEDYIHRNKIKIN
jgi:HlyD family secretion protein